MGNQDSDGTLPEDSNKRSKKDLSILNEGQTIYTYKHTCGTGAYVWLTTDKKAINEPFCVCAKSGLTRLIEHLNETGILKSAFFYIFQ